MYKTIKKTLLFNELLGLYSSTTKDEVGHKTSDSVRFNLLLMSVTMFSLHSDAQKLCIFSQVYLFNNSLKAGKFTIGQGCPLQGKLP